MAQPRTTTLRKSPMPSTCTTASSPGTRFPEASGVPVRITSPGSNVEKLEMNAICEGMSWIRFAVVPLALSTTSPLSENEIAASRQSNSSFVTIQGPRGAGGVEALRARPHRIALLQVAQGHVVDAGEAEHVVHGTFDGHVLRDASDDDRDLRLEVHVMGVGG